MPPPPPHTTKSNRSLAAVFPLVLRGAAVIVQSVRSVPALPLMPTFNAHPNSLTLCSRRRRRYHFSSVETQSLFPRPPRYLSPNPNGSRRLGAPFDSDQSPHHHHIAAGCPDRRADGDSQSSVGRRGVKTRALRRDRISGACRSHRSVITT